MEDFGGKNKLDKAKLVTTALINKHSEYKWLTECFTEINSYCSGESILTLSRGGFCFSIVVVHDQKKFDKLT